MAFRILLVDDEPDIIEFISYNLRREGFEVFDATDGAKAVEKALEVRPHLILLDVMMPGMDGYEACRRIRSHEAMGSALIAFLTARGEDSSQIEGFEAGADDYIPKPIRPAVLVSRVKALLKRSGHDRNAGTPAARAMEVDQERHMTIKNGEEIIMPRKEFNLLSLLYSKPGRVFTREEIYSAIWGDDVVVGDRTIDVHIRKLREKIGDGHIVTVKGVGYKYQD